ncbi:hypothetical protein Btru_046085 [Bulinus truncatus]|nr:hypothetical protein Btru_046085 [Bulinus truncatus]
MGDFEIDAVLQFMLSKGGRVRNHELVTHFKNVLNHPVNKALNREKFKDYVNELATIKLDSGEKVLVLKKKYRPASENLEGSEFSSKPQSTSSASSYVHAKMSSPKPAVSAPNLNSKESSVDPDPSLMPPETKPDKHDPFRAHSEPPASPSELKKDSLDGLVGSKMKSDENMEVILRHTDRVPTSSKPFERKISTSGSNASLASTESHKSSTSSTSGTSGTASTNDDDQNASIISVRDKIKKLDNMASVTDLQQVPGLKKTYKPQKGVEDDDASHSSGVSYVSLTPEQREWLVTSSTSDYQEMNRLLSKNINLAKLRTALHWAAKSGKEQVIKLIANKPGVRVDQKSGYTPLHLAAIHNHERILELLIQTFKADPNIRDHSGKKPKHYLNANSKLQPEELTIFLRHQSKNSNELLASRRLGAEINTNLDDSFARSNERMSKRAKAVSSLLFFKSESAQQLLRSSWNGSNENITEDQTVPFGSANSSPSSVRRKQTPGDMDLMPPPSNAMMSRRMRRADRSKSSSRESLNSQKKGNYKSDENENITRSSSDTSMKINTSV